MREKKTRFCLGVLVLVPFAACIMGFGGFLSTNGQALAASAPDIKIAVVYPLSGAFSRNGNLTVQGIKAAMDWVNDRGGIKSLGGAKLVPVIGDSGSTVEGAANTMERVCRDPEIVMAMGSWASSFTMASTGVTERLGIPHFSISFADKLHERGYKWNFYVSPPYKTLSGVGVPKVVEVARGAGKDIKTAMIVGNNQAASKGFYATCRQYLTPLGVKFIAEETWAIGTLTDATPVMQRVKTLNPDLVVYMGDALAELQMFMMKKKELGVKVPFLCGGGWIGDSSLKFAGEYLESWIAVTSCFPHKFTPKEWLDRTLKQVQKEYSPDDAWVAQELSLAWIMIPIMAEVLERAGSRDRKAIWEEARKLDLHDVLATQQTVGQGMAFDETGRVAEKYRGVVIIQWQGGRPYPIYPPKLALAEPIWPR